MRRDAKGARLWFRKERKDKRGAVTHKGEWVIRDGSHARGTGCSLGDRRGAESALQHYIKTKHEPARSIREPDQIPVADVIKVYLDDVVAGHARPKETAQRMAGPILSYFGDMRLSDITGKVCRDYAKGRSTPSAARRELEDLRSAIRYHWAEGFCTVETKVVMPEKASPRDRWLTRGEVAKLLWTAYRRSPHVARFILVALYTGSRSGVVCSAVYGKRVGGAYIDTAEGVLVRRGKLDKQTKKRKPTAPLSRRLLAHLRRWERDEHGRPVISFNGEPVLRITKAFNKAVAASGLEDVTPHTLRHTAATWLMQAGTDPWKAAGLLGMTVETLLAVYGHHHPEHQQSAAEDLSRKSPTSSPQNNVNSARTKRIPLDEAH